MRGIRPLSLSSLLRAARLAATAGGQPSAPSRLPAVAQERMRSIIGPFGSKSYCVSSTVEMQFNYERDQPLDDGKMTEKESTLHLALSQLASDFDRESNLSLNRFFCTRHTTAIPTGSLKLDLALGIGGLPKGRVIEIFGKEASGKTTLALHIVKEAQKMGGYCAYLDVENALDPSLVEAMGINTRKLLISRPDCAENSLSIVNTLVNSGSVSVIVVDSVAALVPSCELDGMIDMNSEDAQSRLMNQALRKIQCSLSRSQTLVIFVNQVRANLQSNPSFGDINEVTCGGNALRFYAAIRLRISRRGLLQIGDEVTGIGILVQIIKNKFAPAMKKASLDIRFGRGICQESEILGVASSHGIISREGSGYWIKGEFFKDQTEAEKFLVENSGLADELVGVLRAHLLGTTI